MWEIYQRQLAIVAAADEIELGAGNSDINFERNELDEEWWHTVIEMYVKAI